MTKRLLYIAGLGLAVLGVGCFLIFTALISVFDDPPHPTDAAMLAQFASQRKALEALVAMIGEDPEVQRLGMDFTRPDPPPIAPARLADYRARLTNAGIARGFSHYGDKISFIVSTRGLSIAGSAKSFIHAAAPDPEAHQVDGDLDTAFASLADKDALLQRPIADGWWLELDAR